jgi:hypothetical protein
MHNKSSSTRQKNEAISLITFVGLGVLIAVCMKSKQKYEGNIFDTEDGGGIFLRKVDKLLSDYTASHVRRYLPPTFVFL